MSSLRLASPPAMRILMALAAILVVGLVSAGWTGPAGAEDAHGARAAGNTSDSHDEDPHAVDEMADDAATTALEHAEDLTHAHGTHDEDGTHDEHGAHDEHPPELPNFVHLLYKALSSGEDAPPAWAKLMYRFQDIIFALLVAGVIVVVVRVGTRQMEMVPRPLQNAIEYLIDGFRGFIMGILGPGGERYVPFLGTLFIYIWFMNLFGLVPLMRSPTSALNTTAGLAICVFLYVQFTGLTRLGPKKYLLHLAGDPRDVVGWCLVPLMLPLHVIGEFAKPVSLSLRLFGNILGEDVLIGVFAGLGVALLAFSKLPVGLPLHVPFILLAMLLSTVQALVFTLLSTTYIMQMLPHDDHDEGHAEPPESRDAAAQLGGAH